MKFTSSLSWLVLASSAVLSSAALADVDNRVAQSPVRNQMARGTCASFAVAGAMEAIPGIPTELSVQYLYAVMKKTQMRTALEASMGDMLSRYVPVLQEYGVPEEHHLPYNGSPDNDTAYCQWYKMALDPAAKRNLSFLCHARVTDDEFLKTSPYGKYHLGPETQVLARQDAASVEKIKAILDDQRLGKWVRSIPVSYTMLGTHWSDATIRGNVELWHPSMIALVQSKEGVIQLPAGTARETARAKYGWDLEQLARQGWVTFLPSNPAQPWDGHAIQIVGYDSTGFIIKNSWGTAWGDQGYGHISFDFHRFFAQEALVIRSAWTKRPMAETNAKYTTDFRLKSFYDPRAGYLSVSTYTMDIEEPYLLQVTYRVKALDSAGRWVYLGQPFVTNPAATPEYWRQGYGADFRNIWNANARNIMIEATYLSPKTVMTRYYFGVGAAGMHDIRGKIFFLP